VSPWLPIEETTAQHRKIQRAGKELVGSPQSEEAQALGHCTALWLWSLSNCDEDGAFPACDGWLMERACFWKGEEGALVEILCRVDLLERTGETLRLHAWGEHQGKVREGLRRAAEKQRRRREGKKTGGSVPRDVPRDVPSKTDRQTDKKEDKEKTDETDPSVSLSVSNEEACGSPIDEAVCLLERMPEWPAGPIQTRQLVAELAIECPRVDLAHEVNAWRAHIQENRPPRDYVAAFRGWVGNARPTRLEGRGLEELDPDVRCLAEETAAGMDMGA
jgi:hypothetical protein